MSDAINKLGIEPIVSFKDGRGLFVCNEKPVREVEQQRDKALDAFFKIKRIWDVVFPLYFPDPNFISIMGQCVDAITEMDPQHRSWKDIEKVIK